VALVGPKFTNRLIEEPSPYLQQHAHNPVDWYAWGPEAFEKAKAEDKAIFLSIGYSTCHWCHVMAHESFESERVAAILNELYVSIKVDREERPDVDAVYMEFVQRTTAGGGWPLSVFLTPERKPFYGGTYFPPSDVYGRFGFENVLISIDDAWRNRRDEILQSADEITELIQTRIQEKGPLSVDAAILDAAAAVLKHLYDAHRGGFGGAPKFPQPSMLSFLMRQYHRDHDEATLDMVEKTLQKMANGGIHDQLGGGFHRYAVDAQWLVPHFEKMLYDQAQISRNFVEAFQLTGQEIYRMAARDIFDYVLRDLTDPGGGFYSAEDADSEGREGVFYVWTADEIDALLEPQAEQLVKLYYGVTETGNFEDGKSILHVTSPLESAAEQIGLDPQAAQHLLASAKQTLLAARNQRVRPHRDEKIVTGWNGLMLSALAYGGAVLGEPVYLRAAQQCARFVLEHLYRQGRLMRYAGGGQVREYGVLNDYAFLIGGLLDLYQADFEPLWLQRAIVLAEQMIDLFEDKQTGGFYLTGNDAEELVVRTRPDFDGAIPNGNSVAAEDLIRLAELTGDTQWLGHAEMVLAFYQEDLKKRPHALTQMLSTLDQWLGPRSAMVIAVPKAVSPDDDLVHIRTRFLPKTAILLRSPDVNVGLLEKLSTVVKDRETIDESVTVHVCEEAVCRQPVTDFETFCEMVDQL
jgi:hypothetical protein